MNLDKVLNIAGSIVAVSAITVIVSHPESAKVIRAVGDMFSGSLRAAMGR